MLIYSPLRCLGLRSATLHRSKTTRPTPFKTITDTTPTIPASITHAACANPQATVPPTIGTIATVDYESSGANENETSDTKFTDVGQASPLDLGAGPYYATTAFTNSQIDGLGILVKSNSFKDITHYHQWVNGQLDLVGFQAYRSKPSRAA